MSSSSNTELEELDYSEELKLNIKCDNDDSHIAVLYCQKCEVNLCSLCSGVIHCWQAVAKHEIVRLTEKPEPPIYCYLHQQKTAELVCKEPSCDGSMKLICVLCHQHGKHQNHKCEIIEDEYDKIQKTITNCSEIIESKTTACDKNLDEYKRCISTYSTTDNDIMKSERDKIDKFYSDARTSALKTFDDFANTRIKVLKLLQKQYEDDKTKLVMMKNLFRSFEELPKKEKIEVGDHIGTLAGLAEKINEAETGTETAGAIPFESYNITYPSVETIDIKIEMKPKPTEVIETKKPEAEKDLKDSWFEQWASKMQEIKPPNPPEPPKPPKPQEMTSLKQRMESLFMNIPGPRKEEEKSRFGNFFKYSDSEFSLNNLVLQNLVKKTPAVYYANFSFSLSMLFSREMDSVGIKSVETLDKGNLCLYKNGQKILKLKSQPKEDTINLTLYKYIAVVGLWNGLKNYGEDLLDEQMKNTWCSKIIVVLSVKEWDENKELVERIQKIAETDERVEFLNNGDGAKLRKLLFEDYFA